jgi:hypothetical protein
MLRFGIPFVYPSSSTARGKIVDQRVIPFLGSIARNIKHFTPFLIQTTPRKTPYSKRRLLYNSTNRISACISDQPHTHIACGAHTATHTTPQCLTQQCLRQASRPSFSAVQESHSTPSHLRPRICLKHSSQSRIVPWSGTLWTGVIAWESLVCLVLAHRL